jgi:hypothetical protein
VFIRREWRRWAIERAGGGVEERFERAISSGDFSGFYDGKKRRVNGKALEPPYMAGREASLPPGASGRTFEDPAGREISEVALVWSK